MRKDYYFNTDRNMLHDLHLFYDSSAVNSLYFMENSPIRSYLNPAFNQPVFLFGITRVGLYLFEFGNNSLTLKIWFIIKMERPSGFKSGR